MAIVLQTARLLFRPLRPDDFDALAALYGDPDVVRFLGTGQVLGREFIEKILARTRADETYTWTQETLDRLPQLLRAKERKASFSMWGVIERTSEKFVGHCGLLAWDLDGQKEVEVAYVLRKEFWGRGLATEAARACRDYAIDVLGFDRLISIIKPENLGSQRVAIKNGMHHERDTMVQEWPVRVYSFTRHGRNSIQ